MLKVRCGSSIKSTRGFDRCLDQKDKIKIKNKNEAQFVSPFYSVCSSTSNAHEEGRRKGGGGNIKKFPGYATNQQKPNLFRLLGIVDRQTEITMFISCQDHSRLEKQPALTQIKYHQS